MIFINNFDNFKNFDYKALSQILLSLSPQEIAVLASLIGTICTLNLTNEELNVLGNFIQTVGQIISLAQAQGVLLEQQNTTNINDFNNFKKEIEYKINYLYQIFNIKLK